MEKKSERFWSAIIFVGLLVFAALFIMRTEPLGLLRAAVENNLALGMAVFVLIEAASIVIVPVTTVLLIPVAADLFGAFATAVLSILGWGLGSVAAFVVARQFGLPVAERFVGKEKLDGYRKILDEGEQFWTIVLLRILFPVDVISYVLGLFSTLSVGKYSVATFMGISPFAFFYSYAGQALAMGRYGKAASLAAAAGLAFLAAWFVFKRMRKRR